MKFESVVNREHIDIMMKMTIILLENWYIIRNLLILLFHTRPLHYSILNLYEKFLISQVHKRYI